MEGPKRSLTALGEKSMISPRIANIKVACLRKTGYNSLEDWLEASPNHMYWKKYALC